MIFIIFFIIFFCQINRFKAGIVRIHNFFFIFFPKFLILVKTHMICTTHIIWLFVLNIIILPATKHTYRIFTFNVTQATYFAFVCVGCFIFNSFYIFFHNFSSLFFVFIYYIYLLFTITTINRRIFLEYFFYKTIFPKFLIFYNFFIVFPNFFILVER